MFVIRQEQRHALGREGTVGFGARMSEHLLEHFPAQCQALPEGELERIIADGIERAAEHHLFAEVCVSKYLMLMFTFGADFDRSEWLSEMVDEHLDFSEGRHEFFRIDDLVDAALQRLEEEPWLAQLGIGVQREVRLSA
ncbi:MAG: hypothetical protein AAF799_07805 [Myxococcota bacterium]